LRVIIWRLEFLVVSKILKKYMNAYLKYFLLMTIFCLNTIAHIVCMSKCFIS